MRNSLPKLQACQSQSSLPEWHLRCRLRVRLGGSRNHREVEVDDIFYSSLIDMAEGGRARKFSPVELVDAHLSRLHELNPELQRQITICRSASRRADLHKKLYRCCRVALRMRQLSAKRKCPFGRCAAGEKAAHGGRHHSGKYKRTRISDGV